MSDATTNYEIYLVNEGSHTRDFWCFLDKPEITSTNEVYANSSVMLAVRPNYGGQNKFTIPLQYQVGAGASNKAVGLNVKIDSSYFWNSKLGTKWKATYHNIPPYQGPNLAADGYSMEDTVSIKSSSFDKVTNENYHWFANMSFGILSSNGFMGCTWSPNPLTTSIIQPKFSFYIATGDFQSNALVNITTVSTNAAKVELNNFEQLAVTVTLKQDGTWKVTPGKPKK